MDVEVKVCDHCDKWGKEDLYLNVGWIQLSLNKPLHYATVGTKEVRMGEEKYREIHTLLAETINEFIKELGNTVISTVYQLLDWVATKAVKEQNSENV